MPRASRSRLRRRALQQRQRLLVNRIGSNATVQPRDRFGVVVENVRLRVENGVERTSSPLKSGISTSILHCGFIARTCRTVSAQCAAPPSGRSSRLTEVITAWARSRLPTASATCLGSSAIEISGFSFSDCAKSAMPRADVAAEHERRRSIRPALKNVRTARFLTNRVQVESLDQFEHMVLIGRIAQADAQPFRLGLTDLLIVTDYA